MNARQVLQELARLGSRQQNVGIGPSSPHVVRTLLTWLMPALRFSGQQLVKYCNVVQKCQSQEDLDVTLNV
jgi:hypothetical protein